MTDFYRVILQGTMSKSEWEAIGKCHTSFVKANILPQF